LLEADSSLKLSRAGKVGLRGDFAEARDTHLAVWKSELRVVEHVEHFAGKLERSIVCQRKTLAEDGVEIGFSVRTNRWINAWLVTEAEGSGLCEACGVEPFRGSLRAMY
jgi:hypothetical protein